MDVNNDLNIDLENINRPIPETTRLIRWNNEYEKRWDDARGRRRRTGRATNPLPENNAFDMEITGLLAWQASNGAITHDVYFGVNPNLTQTDFHTNTDQTEFDPGQLNYSTDYFWRVDTIHNNGKVTGEIWKFRTADSSTLEFDNAENPTPPADWIVTDYDLPEFSVSFTGGSFFLSEVPSQPGLNNLLTTSGRDKILYIRDGVGNIHFEDFDYNPIGVTINTITICPGNYNNITYIIEGYNTTGAKINEVSNVLNATDPQTITLNGFENIHRLHFMDTTDSQRSLAEGAFGTDIYLGISDIDINI